MSPNQVPLREWIKGILNTSMSVAAVLSEHIPYTAVPKERQEAFFGIMANHAALCATSAAILGSVEAAKYFSSVAIKFGEMSDGAGQLYREKPTIQ